MLKTMDLEYIYDTLGEDIFDFEYTWTDITIGGVAYTKQYIQDAFKDYWWYYQIGYSTLDEFKWRIKRSWKSTISVFASKLNLYPTELNLTDKTINKEFENNTDNKYSDTPNQVMTDAQSSGYLTDRTKIDIGGNSTETEQSNALSKYAEINNKIKDVMYEYIKSFKDLFLTDVIIYSGILGEDCNG